MTFDEVYAYTQHLSVLYVEDEKEIRKSTIHLLENYFENIDVAEDGSKGLEYYKESLKKKPYDIVISDITMPNLNGVDMIEKIRALKNDQTVAFLSAHHDKEYLLEASKIGVDHFILKPINLDAFSKVLYDCAKQVFGQLKVLE